MKTNLIEHLNTQNVKHHVPQIQVGDTVRVHSKIKEGNKERIQVFEGVVIAMKHGEGVNGTFTVRKISNGIGVERVFPVHSPNVEKVEVKRRSKVRRAKLNYLKDLTGKKARLKEEKFDALVVNAAVESATEMNTDFEQKDTDKESVNISADEGDKSVKISDEQSELAEDELNIAEVSTEEIAKEEDKKSEKVEATEEEEVSGDDESQLPAAEVEEVVEKVEEKETKEQG